MTDYPDFRIQLTHGTHQGHIHGQPWEMKGEVINLDADFIYKVTGSVIQSQHRDLSVFNGLIANFTFHTNLGRVHGPYGTEHGLTLTDHFEASGGKLVSISGNELKTLRPPYLTNLSFLFRGC